MIFGFNTDIRHEETVYHVQSEAREAERLLQTQIFVKGRCIGKRAIPYGSGTREDLPNNDLERESRLRELHREVVDAIRSGRLEAILDQHETPEILAATKELEVEWINAGSVLTKGALSMRVRVTEGGAAVQGARLTLRFARANALPFYTQVLTDAKGNAEISVHVDEHSLADSSVLVQASFAGKTATRKFQLRSTV